jgi:hypothetical protein
MVEGSLVFVVGCRRFPQRQRGPLNQTMARNPSKPTNRPTRMITAADT